METPNFRFENSGFLLDQHSFFSLFFKLLSIPLNNQHQASTEEKLNETVPFFNKIMLHPSRAPLSNYVKLKSISKVYRVLYNDSAGENTLSKCQRTDEFTRKVRTLLYYIHTTTCNRINYNLPRVLLQFHTRRRFRTSLSVRASNSAYPVTYARQFCKNKYGQKIYWYILVRSTRHRTLIHNPMILHTKTFFAPVCHQQKIYRCVTARYTRHHTLLHDPTILHMKTFLAPTYHPCQKYCPLQIRFKKNWVVTFPSFLL